MPQITQLKLTNFRSYPAATISFEPGINIITGQNGMGKTNLLEAVSLLSPGRGIRSSKLDEIAKIGETEWSVIGEVDGYQIITGLENGRERRTVKVDGEKQNGSNALAPYCSCIWLTPQMDNIFLESSGERRRFFDRLIYNFDPEHASRVAVYDNAMRERLRLLKNGQNDDRWLKVLEERMVEYGVAIAAARNEVLGYLQNAIDKSTSSFPKSEITINGKYESLIQDKKALEVEEIFKNDLRESRQQDQYSGRTTCGVSRTDFTIIHNIKQMPAALCSTGEQKALLLSIILSLGRLLKERKNRAPILLLDEVVSHLDEVKRGELFDEINSLGAQAILTGTDKELFEKFQGKFFDINEEGKVAA